MKVDNVKNIGVGAFNTAKSVAKRAYKTVNSAFLNESARGNFKNSLPAAIGLAALFSLFSALPNRKADGKQGKIERKSGNIAMIAFLAASFKNFFNVENKSLKDLFKKVKQLNLEDALEILKVNKTNAILMAVTAIGVKIATDILTKGLDCIINDNTGVKKLGD